MSDIIKVVLLVVLGVYVTVSGNGTAGLLLLGVALVVVVKRLY